MSCMKEDEELSSALKNDQAGGSADEAYNDIYPPNGDVALDNKCGMNLKLSATDDVGVTGYFISKIIFFLRMLFGAMQIGLKIFLQLYQQILHR